MVKKYYTIDFAEGVEEDLAELCAYDQARILDKIDEQLIYAPARETRNKKCWWGWFGRGTTSNLRGNYVLANIESSTMWTRKR
jgi:hypothetical protein